MNKPFFSNCSFDTPIFENSNFKIIPSIGSLVKGWLLIVPKSEFLSFRDIPAKTLKDMEEIKRQAILYLKNEFDDFIFFEHGPNKKNLNVGCSVDYAHLHLVPLKIDVRKQLTLVEPVSENWNWHEIDNISEIAKINLKDPYLFYTDNNSKSYVCFKEDFPSQLFRKVIAKFITKSSQYNWREYPFLDNVRETYNLFSYEKKT